MISLNIEVSDATELQKQIMGLAGSTFLSQYHDESLLSELRQRMAVKGFVVKVVPFDEEGVTGVTNETHEADTPESTTTMEPPRGRPGRKARPITAPPTAPVQPESKPEAPKLVAPASDTAKAMTETTAETTAQVVGYTDADVKAALNLFAAANGQMKAREKIKTVGGSDRLMDVKPEKYGELIAALAVEKVAA